jgi:nucleoside-diphosphate-sugar epimerase
MTVLVTGGAGFLGTRLIQSLLAGAIGPAPARVICIDQVASAIEDPRVVSVIGSVADAGALRAAVPPDVTTIWHLAAVLSGQSEAEPDLAMAVNVRGTQALLDACRTVASPPRFVFSSTVAVFGGPLPAVVPEDHALRPASTYGTSKAIAELLVLEATRRGVVDGIACRVPTVSVRPGRPNSAMSSFVSGIVREPLAGIESVCPVPLETRLWVSSPAVTTANLAHAGRLSAETLDGVQAINLPGICVTPAQLLDSLERAAGADVRRLVRLEPDARIAAVVQGWPGAIDASRALRLGFSADRDADALVTQFIADHASSR